MPGWMVPKITFIPILYIQPVELKGAALNKALHFWQVQAEIVNLLKSGSRLWGIYLIPSEEPTLGNSLPFGHRGGHQRRRLQLAEVASESLDAKWILLKLKVFIARSSWEFWPVQDHTGVLLRIKQARVGVRPPSSVWENITKAPATESGESGGVMQRWEVFFPKK